MRIQAIDDYDTENEKVTRSQVRRGKTYFAVIDVCATFKMRVTSRS